MMKDRKRQSPISGIRSTLYQLLCITVTMMTFLGSVVLNAEVSEAATFYVATNGSDSNSGTQSQPFRTIKKGISVLSAGSTLFIRAGTYGENIDSAVQTIPTGTSWSNVVTVAAYPGERVQLGYIALYQSYIRYVVFDGLIVSPSAGAATSNEAFYLSNGANHIRFQNGEITNARTHGVLIVQGADYNEFINVSIHDNGVWGTPGRCYGMYIAGSNNLVENSRIYNNPGYGIHVYNEPDKLTNNNIIRNNRIYNNGVPTATSFGIILSSGNGNTAYNNLVYNNTAGILVDYSASNSKVYNNTIYSNVSGGYAGIVVGSGSTGATLKNNIIYQNAYDMVSNSGTNTVTSNNLTTNPSFVNAAASDFHLQSGSAANNAGATLTDVTTDFDGVPRPQGNFYAIGAFEYKVSSSSPPSPPSNLTVSP